MKTQAYFIFDCFLALVDFSLSTESFNWENANLIECHAFFS